MKAKLILFIQALAFFIIGIYLSSQGLPSSEVDIIKETGGEIMDSLDDISDSPEVHEIAENTKSFFAVSGFFITIFSVLELIGLGVSVFK